MLTKHKLTVENLLTLEAASAFQPDKRLELLEGELWSRAPVSSLHTRTVSKLQKLLHKLLGEEAATRTNNPMYL